MTQSNSYYAYIRVSTTKQGEKGVSLQEQKSAIERYADQNSLIITEWFEEQVTAAKKGRPLFNAMITALKNGEAKGLIIHKIDRGARNLRDWSDLGDMIDLGLDVHFANESLDMSSRGGRLSADIQAVVAADYIRNLREETKKGIYGRLRQGLYPFRAPIGYLDMGKGKRKEIDPVNGPIVKKLFDLYATGEYGLHALKKEAKLLGLTTRGGKQLSLNGLSTILHNPFYTGLIRIKKTGDTFQGIHEPIITTTLFQAVQDIFEGKIYARPGRHDFLYKRLLKCKHCDYSLIGERQKGNIYYRCHQKECPTKGIREEKVNDFVQDRFSLLDLGKKENRLFFREIQKYKEHFEQERKEVLASCTLLLGEIETKLIRLTDAFLEGDVDREMYHTRKEAFLKEKLELEEKQRSFNEDEKTLIDEITEFLELAEMASLTYRSAYPVEKRRILKAVTSNRLVDRKNVEVELSKPFSIIANRYVLQDGDPSAGRPRTLLDLLVKYLKGRRLHRP